MITNNVVLETIKNRRSIRSYTQEQIKDEELEAILEAGRYAPSAINQQLWHFTVIQNQVLLSELNRSAKEVAAQFDDEHIRKLGENEKLNIFYGAPTVILVSGKKGGLQAGSDIGTAARELLLEDSSLVKADCAAATQNMLLAAESLNLGACWVNLTIFAFASEKGQQFRQQLQLPEGYNPLYSVIVGHKKLKQANAPVRKGNVVNYVR